MDQMKLLSKLTEVPSVRIVGCLALLALALPVAASPDVLLLNLFTSKGNFSYTVSTELANRLPKWNSAKEQPPLEIGRAIKIASRTDGRPLPNGTRTSLHEVRLSRTASSEKVLVWFYQIDLQPIGQAPDGPNIPIIILMDGSIVSPKVYKAQTK